MAAQDSTTKLPFFVILFELDKENPFFKIRSFHMKLLIKLLQILITMFHQIDFTNFKIDPRVSRCLHAILLSQAPSPYSDVTSVDSLSC